MVNREAYLNKLRGYKDKQLIKVITGIRRYGKSMLLQLFKEEMLHDGISSEQIIAINFEDMDYALRGNIGTFVGQVCGDQYASTQL